MKNASIVLLTILVLTSCSSRSLFSKKTQHEQYAEKLEKNGLDETPAGRDWRAAAVAALTNAQAVGLPYAQKGTFYNDQSRALGLEFEAQRGEKLDFHLSKIGAGDFVVYADLFKVRNDKFEPVLSGDTNVAEMSFEVEETGRYVLRLQPEIARTGQYRLSIQKGPSIGFPVANNKGKTGSFWGDSREGGKRRHEGIDIFAPKMTPAIAAADGVITGVNEGGIGGKTIWLRLNGRNITLYYAHLDRQMVREGQQVKKGDVLGLIGNTGNAKYTASHLHFGAIPPQDPLIHCRL
jgi:peptidoglycan LD-endopeptidase LytH